MSTVVYWVAGSSDYDLLAVLAEPPTEERVAALAALHDELLGSEPDAVRLEGDHVPQILLTAEGTTRPVHHFRRGRLAAERASMLSADNVANMRRSGIAVIGPAPAAVLPQVSRDQVRAAARAMLFGASTREFEGDAAQEILGMLRSARAAETGLPSSKSDGVRWGRAHPGIDRGHHRNEHLDEIEDVLDARSKS